MNDKSTIAITAGSLKQSVSASSIISKYQNCTRDDIIEETPHVISAEITLLASKLHEVGVHTILAEQKYHEKWVNIRSEVDTDGQATARAKKEPEYYELQMARLNEKTVIELLRALKKLLQSKHDSAMTGI